MCVLLNDLLRKTIAEYVQIYRADGYNDKWIIRIGFEMCNFQVVEKNFTFPSLLLIKMINAETETERETEFARERGKKYSFNFLKLNFLLWQQEFVC